MFDLITLPHFIVFLYFIVLVLRLILDLLQSFARDWRPSGVVLVVAEGVYTLTDPPLRLLRRVIPSPVIGSIRFDLSFLVLFLAVNVLMGSLPS